jgi:hypothetical protein
VTKYKATTSFFSRCSTQRESFAESKKYFPPGRSSKLYRPLSTMIAADLRWTQMVSLLRRSPEKGLGPLGRLLPSPVRRSSVTLIRDITSHLISSPLLCTIIAVIKTVTKRLYHIIAASCLDVSSTLALITATN